MPAASLMTTPLLTGTPTTVCILPEGPVAASWGARPAPVENRWHTQFQKAFWALVFLRIHLPTTTQHRAEAAWDLTSPTVFFFSRFLLCAGLKPEVALRVQGWLFAFVWDEQVRPPHPQCDSYQQLPYRMACGSPSKLSFLFLCLFSDSQTCHLIAKNGRWWGHEPEGQDFHLLNRGQ